MSSPTIPLIDFTSFISPSSSASSAPTPAQLTTAQALTSACRTIGFVQITNHGILSSKVAEAFAWSKKLFALPRSEKMKAPHPSGAAVHRGYSWPGLEKVSDIVLAEGEEVEEGKGVREVADVKESYEIGSDEYADQPNVWLPEDVLPGFREFTTEFYWECEKFTRLLMQALALGLGLEDRNALAKFHNGHENQLRLLHYPPVKAELLEKDVVERMPAHTDWGTLTILFQDEVGGLECLEREGGEFVKVGWVDGAVVMNLGDALGRWSNDMLRSTMHRVGPPPAENNDMDKDRMIPSRYSIPYFVGPDADTVLDCLPACTDAEHPPKYEPITWNDYRLMRGKAHYLETAVA